MHLTGWPHSLGPLAFDQQVAKRSSDVAHDAAVLKTCLHTRDLSWPKLTPQDLA